MGRSRRRAGAPRLRWVRRRPSARRPARTVTGWCAACPGVLDQAVPLPGCDQLIPTGKAHGRGWPATGSAPSRTGGTGTRPAGRRAIAAARVAAGSAAVTVAESSPAAAAAGRWSARGRVATGRDPLAGCRGIPRRRSGGPWEGPVGLRPPGAGAGCGGGGNRTVAASSVAGWGGSASVETGDRVDRRGRRQLGFRAAGALGSWVSGCPAALARSAWRCVGASVRRVAAAPRVTAAARRGIRSSWRPGAVELIDEPVLGDGPAPDSPMRRDGDGVAPRGGVGQLALGRGPGLLQVALTASAVSTAQMRHLALQRRCSAVRPVSASERRRFIASVKSSSTSFRRDSDSAHAATRCCSACARSAVSCSRPAVWSVASSVTGRGDLHLELGAGAGVLVPGSRRPRPGRLAGWRRPRPARRPASWAARASASRMLLLGLGSARPSISPASSSASRSMERIRSLMPCTLCGGLTRLRTCTRSRSARARASSSSLASCADWSRAASRSAARIWISASSRRRWAVHLALVVALADHVEAAVGRSEIGLSRPCPDRTGTLRAGAALRSHVGDRIYPSG